MKKLYLRYGNGKTTNLCQTAYNYYEAGAKVAIINADANKEIRSKIENDKSLTLEPTLVADDNLFLKGFCLKQDGVEAILVDNAHLLTKNQVDQLYYVCKIFDITVIAYGERMVDGVVLEGAKRLLELANDIKPVEGFVLPTSNLHLNFYYGAMNTCKTSSLIINAFDLEKRGEKVVIIKPLQDRTIEYVSSRIGLKRRADIVLDRDSEIGDINHVLGFRKNNIKHILADEAQFLTESQIKSLEELSIKLGINVSCYGLRTDFLTNSFEGSARLMAVANLNRLRTVCHCDNHYGANFNARRYKNGEYITDGPQVAIDDGREIVYDALCDHCYIRDVQGIDVDNPSEALKTLEKKKIVRISI